MDFAFIYLIIEKKREQFEMSTLTINRVIDKIKARVAAFDISTSSITEQNLANGLIQLNIVCDEPDDDDDDTDDVDEKSSNENKIHHWLINFKHLVVLKGIAAKPDCLLEVNKSDFLELGAKTLTLIDALAKGKIHITGNSALVAVFVEILLSL